MYLSFSFSVSVSIFVLFVSRRLLSLIILSHSLLRLDRVARAWKCSPILTWVPVKKQKHKTVKYFSPKTNLCIIRVARDPHKLAWASVTLITAVDGRRYVPHVVHVSGAPRPPPRL